MLGVIHGEAYFTYGVFLFETIAGYLVTQEVVDELHILNLAIAKNHQRQGLATKILGKVMAESYRRGRRFAYLEVREQNTAAIKLYESLGFRIITKRVNYYEKSHEDALLMMAKIPKDRRS